MTPPILRILSLLCLSTPLVPASELIEAGPLTDRIILLHFDDGYVVHHGKGQKRSEAHAVVQPLNVELATKLSTYKISSDDDETFGKGLAPESIGRKSKGTDFAWMCETWQNNACVNTNADHAKEHWIYLNLSHPMQQGKTYTVATGNLATNGSAFKINFDVTKARSEAVHVNTIGYAPRAPEKFGYVYQWMGDKGSLDLKSYEGNEFRVVNTASGETAVTGKLAFRKKADNQETHHVSNTPNGNFVGADVYECDFSSLTNTGTYVLAVDGIGASYPFKVDPDVYREPFYITARGLYHNRSGIALKKPYTEFERPAPHNPKLTPGFKLYYTTSRFCDWKSGDHDPSDKDAIEKGIKGTLDVWGFYQDAGDWDSYESHLNVAQCLLFAFETAPKNFVDGELNIPESKNGVPDILDEAAWLPRFCHRLRQELLKKGWGSGGVGLRVCGDHFGSDAEGTPSYLDVHRKWTVSGEDPFSTYRYAGVAAHLAYALSLAGVAKDPEGVNWTKEATESFAWAEKAIKKEEVDRARGSRGYAAASLFKLTGDPKYQEAYREASATMPDKGPVWGSDFWSPAAFALAGGKAQPDAALLERSRAQVLGTADSAAIETRERRALRWGGNFFFPMLIGHQTTPWIMEAAVAYAITKTNDVAKAEKYLAAAYTTCDYFLGCGPLHSTWTTGLGPRHPQQVFHMDAWYNGKGAFHPGIIPYGPWLKGDKKPGHVTSADWPNATCYPGIDSWPGAERWFDNRNSPLSAEFTIHQNTCHAAAIYGFLSAAKK